MTCRSRSLLVLVALAMISVPVAAQTSACRPADSASARMVRFVQNIATGTDSAALKSRAQMHIPPLSASQVTYVTDTRVCSKAVAPYDGVTGMHLASTGQAIAPSGQLYVVQAGSVLVVWDPVKKAGEFSLLATLNGTNYKVLWHGLT